MLASFSTGKDSPVNDDSSVFKLMASVKRKSAGTVLPSSKMTMSPRTSSSAFNSTSFPSLLTTHVGEDIFFKASNDFSALFSCTVPMIAFNTQTPKIMIGSAKSNDSPFLTTLKMEIATLNNAAAKRMKIIGSLNWPKNTKKSGVFFFSGNLFGPYLTSLSPASWLVKPCSTLLSSCCKTSLALFVSNIILSSKKSY